MKKEGEASIFGIEKNLTQNERTEQMSNFLFHTDCCERGKTQSNSSRGKKSEALSSVPIKKHDTASRFVVYCY